MPADPGFDALLPWHVDAWAQLQTRRRERNLPHALLLGGPEGIGKQQFAKRFAQALVCEHAQIERQPCGQCKSCHLAMAGSHPDIHWLTPEAPGKQIRIDAMRSLIARTSLTTQGRGSRVFLISPADAMNRNTANALLKTLEEPGSASVLILLSCQVQALPATIRSRCQTIAFRPVSRELASDWLTARVNSAQVDDLLALTAGAPLLALRADKEGWLARSARLIDQLQALKLRERNPLQVVEEWAALDVHAMFQDFGRVLHDLVQWRATGQSAYLLLPQQASRLQSLANDIHLTGLFGFVDELNALRQGMSNNLNPRMLLEKIAVDWLTLTRKRPG